MKEKKVFTVGDRVMLLSRGTDLNYRRGIVKSVSPKRGQLLVSFRRSSGAFDMKFDSSGWRLPRSWQSGFIKHTTDELLDEAKHYHLSKRLARIKWSDLPLDVLQKVCAVLKEHGDVEEADQAKSSG